MQKTFNIVSVQTFDPDKGWFIARSDLGETVVGSSIIPPFGMISVEANFVKHPRFGNQWKCKYVMYAGIQEITQGLLSSGLVKGINQAKAPDVFNAFQHDIWRILSAAVDGDEFIEFKGHKRNPVDLLQDARGVGPVVAEEMVESWRDQRKIFTSAINAVRCGLSISQFRDIIKQQDGREKFDMMIHNSPPYNVYDLVTFGMKWSEVDALAMQEWPEKAAIQRNSPIRCAGAIKHILKTMLSDGHMCGDVSKVDNEVEKLIGISSAVSSLPNLEDVGLVVFKGFVYTKQSYLQETAISHAITRIRNTRYDRLNISREEIHEFEDSSRPLHPDQVEAIHMALTKKVCSITGGPGSGKTTTLEVLVRILEDRGQDVLLCAFMGAAARRMSIATDHPAGTLHSTFGLMRDKEERVVMKEGWLIVDEMSTVSSGLLRDFLEQLYNDVHVVFVGDVDQLPPVGNGEGFVQILESDIPQVRLTHLFRNGGAIAQACRDVNAGIMPTPDNKDFFLINQTREEDIPSRLLKAEEWFSHPDQGYMNPQILTPLNIKAGVGRSSMNILLQNVRNPDGEKIPFTNIRVGDRVVQLKNNYDLEVRNGMTGQCISRTDDARMILQTMKDNEANKGFEQPLFGDSGSMDILSVMFEEEVDPRIYSNYFLEELDLGYAITVHKSQGNQFDYVFVVLPNLPNELSMRQIPYTAMSRAKKKLVVIAAPGVLEKCIQNTARMRRNSNLAAFLRGE